MDGATALSMAGKGLKTKDDVVTSLGVPQEAKTEIGQVTWVYYLKDRKRLVVTFTGADTSVAAVKILDYGWLRDLKGDIGGKGANP